MRVERTPDQEFLVWLDRDELVTFNNALNEVCNGMDVWEFSTRMGSQRDRAIELLTQLKRALDES